MSRLVLLYLAHLFWWPIRALLSLNRRPRLGPVVGPVAPHPGHWRSASSDDEEALSEPVSMSRMLSFDVVSLLVDEADVVPVVAVEVAFEKDPVLDVGFLFS